MSSEEFREWSHRTVDWVANYLEGLEARDVLPRIAPGDVRRKLPAHPPARGESPGHVLEDMDRVIPGRLTRSMSSSTCPGASATPDDRVSIEDCEPVTRDMSAILDVEDPLPCAYTLEVSSPGLDRPLRGRTDYERFAGRLAKIVVSEAVDNQKAFEGRLRGLDGGDVLFEAQNGRMHRLPLELIRRARLDVEF
jgi:ribosome maturation factor RimP